MGPRNGAKKWGQEAADVEFKFWFCVIRICANHNTTQIDVKTNLFHPMSLERLEQYKKSMKQMFIAPSAGELRPLSCKAGNFDLVKWKIFGNFTELARSVERLRYEDNISLNRKRKTSSRNKNSDRKCLFEEIVPYDYTCKNIYAIMKEIAPRKGIIHCLFWKALMKTSVF